MKQLESNQWDETRARAGDPPLPRTIPGDGGDDDDDDQGSMLSMPGLVAPSWLVVTISGATSAQPSVQLLAHTNHQPAGM